MPGSEPNDRKDLPSVKGYTFLRELGSRPVPVYAARITRKGARAEPVVIERFARERSIHADDVVEFTRNARAVASAKPSFLVPLNEVVIDGDAILLVGDLVDAESLASLWSLGTARNLAMPLPIALRVLIDVLAGLEELHRLRDAQRKVLCMVHGELAPGTVLVQTDGRARLAHYCRVKWVALKVPSSVGYLAPELLLQEGELDHRADIYSAGAILFEAISGKPPFPGGKVSTVIRSLTTGAVPRLEVPSDKLWAAPLVDIVSRAMAVDRVERFDSAAQMADHVREAASGHIATEAEVAAWVARLAGTKILQRRNGFSSPGTPRTRSRPPAPDHGKPKRLEPPVPPAPRVPVLGAKEPDAPRPVPMPGVAAEGRDAGPLPVPLDTSADDVEIPIPVVAVGEPSVDEPESKKASADVPDAPVPGPAPSPMAGQAHPGPASPAIPAPLPDVLRGGDDAREHALTVEPMLADSSEPRVAKRRWWPLLVAAAAGLCLLVVGIWVVGFGSSDDGSAAVPASATTRASKPIETPGKGLAAFAPGTAPETTESAPAPGIEADASTDAADAADEPDAQSAKPSAPVRPPRPRTRPRPANTYDPMGI